MRSDAQFTARALPNEAGVTRLTVSARRELGSAVRRNRARRRLREAVRRDLRSRGDVPPTDLFLVARRPAFDSPAVTLATAVSRALDGLLRR